MFKWCCLDLTQLGGNNSCFIITWIEWAQVRERDSDYRNLNHSTQLSESGCMLFWVKYILVFMNVSVTVLISGVVDLLRQGFWRKLNQIVAVLQSWMSPLWLVFSVCKTWVLKKASAIIKIAVKMEVLQLKSRFACRCGALWWVSEMGSCCGPASSFVLRNKWGQFS